MSVEAQYGVMGELGDRLRHDEESRFVAAMLVLSVLILVAVVREARGDDD